VLTRKLALRLNRQSVAALSIPPGKPYLIVWDDALPGFGVRVNPTGKVWVVQYRAGGKSRRETIGRVELIALDAARDAARKKLARVRLGADPHAERAEARARAAVTFGIVVERYLINAKARLKRRSFEELERHLRKHWGPLHPIPLHKVARDVIASRLEDIAVQNGPVASNRARAAISALFSYALGTGIADSNPVIGTIKAAEEARRDHVISEAELAAIWPACAQSDHGRIVKLLLLTAQRRDEVADMRWSELDLNRALWTIPRERTKNGLMHEVPLSDLAMRVLSEASHRYGRDLVFGDGAGGFSGWSKAKARFDESLRRHGVAVRPWRLHDLRRTAATGMAVLGVQPHVVEAVLNHVSGHKAGVAGIYNRAQYTIEKRDGLDRWARHVETILSTPGHI
jgi:integrase